MFDYDTADYLSDKSKKHDVPVRAEGLLHAAGGAAAMVAGVGACETGAACVVGGYLWVTGSDNLIAGVNQIISGTPTKTVGASILESIGVPAEYSELVYAGFDVATGMTSVIVKSIKTGQMRQVVLPQNGKTTQIVGNALKDFAASKQGSIKIPGTGAGKGTITNSVASELTGITQKQLDKKFKHAADFGITTKKNSETLSQYEAAIKSHMGDTATEFQGTYGFVADSKAFFNPNTNNAVVLDKSGNFVMGFKLTPGTPQYDNYMKNGVLR